MVVRRRRFRARGRAFDAARRRGAALRVFLRVVVELLRRAPRAFTTLPPFNRRNPFLSLPDAVRPARCLAMLRAPFFGLGLTRKIIPHPTVGVGMFHEHGTTGQSP